MFSFTWGGGSPLFARCEHRILTSRHRKRGPRQHGFQVTEPVSLLWLDAISKKEFSKFFLKKDESFTSRSTTKFLISSSPGCFRDLLLCCAKLRSGKTCKNAYIRRKSYPETKEVELLDRNGRFSSHFTWTGRLKLVAYVGCYQSTETRRNVIKLKLFSCIFIDARQFRPNLAKMTLSLKINFKTFFRATLLRKNTSSKHWRSFRRKWSSCRCWRYCLARCKFHWTEILVTFRSDVYYRRNNPIKRQNW